MPGRTYDLEGFKAGRCALMEIDRREVGEVSGRSLLHLQCHFGMDTLSWARRGARVTGVDFSPRAIALAGALAAELALEAEFYCCELNRFPGILNRAFDIVYTSGGVLPWLPDWPGGSPSTSLEIWSWMRGGAISSTPSPRITKRTDRGMGWRGISRR